MPTDQKVTGLSPVGVTKKERLHIVVSLSCVLRRTSCGNDRQYRSVLIGIELCLIGYPNATIGNKKPSMNDPAPHEPAPSTLSNKKVSTEYAETIG